MSVASSAFFGGMFSIALMAGIGASLAKVSDQRGANRLGRLPICSIDARSCASRSGDVPEDVSKAWVYKKPKALFTSRSRLVRFQIDAESLNCDELKLGVSEASYAAKLRVPPSNEQPKEELFNSFFTELDGLKSEGIKTDAILRVAWNGKCR